MHKIIAYHLQNTTSAIANLLHLCYNMIAEVQQIFFTYKIMNIIVRVNLPVYLYLEVEENNHGSVQKAVRERFVTPRDGDFIVNWQHVHDMLAGKSVSTGPMLMDDEDGYDRCWELTHGMNPYA